jgi:hypothetical protein
MINAPAQNGIGKSLDTIATERSAGLGEQPHTAERQERFYESPSPSDSLATRRGEGEQELELICELASTKWPYGRECLLGLLNQL